MPNEDNYSTHPVKLGTTKKEKFCISCGLIPLAKYKKFHSNECRNKLMFYLDISKHTLNVLETQHAFLYFTREQVVLDVLPKYKITISRFSSQTYEGMAYHEALKSLIFYIGDKWHVIKNRLNSRFKATENVLLEHAKPEMQLEIFMPKIKKCQLVISLTPIEIESMCILSLTTDQLISENREKEIKNTYRKSALRYHPDRGGKHEDMIAINMAVETLLNFCQSKTTKDQLIPKNREEEIKNAYRKSSLRYRPVSCENIWYFEGKTDKWWTPA